MTPEILCENRPVRTIPVQPGADVIYDADGEPCVLKMNNDRGPMEVLITPEKKDQFLPALLGTSPLSLTGYFRRRSGYRADGTRHFIWCLILFSAEEEAQDTPLAA